MKEIITAKLLLERDLSGSGDPSLYVVTRNPDDIRADALDLPGGELEAADNDDPWLAVLREFEEEVGDVPDDIMKTAVVVDERMSSFGHWNIRHFVYASTRREVRRRRNTESRDGFWLPLGFAAVTLGHVAQRQAALGRLPAQLVA